jgi:Holliday junction resolvase RusA-like endonuclease
MTIAFTVPGRPAPQGSKQAFVNKHTGRASLVEMSWRHKDWRAVVSLAAAERMSGLEPLDHGLDLNLAAVFRFCRPASHYGSGKNSRVLKPSAPNAPRKPDLSKLVRSIEDAMTGIVYHDDDQIVSYDGTRKAWCDRWETPGVDIEVCEVPYADS